MPDLLDNLWIRVINLDFGGKDGWSTRLKAASTNAKEPLAIGAAAAFANIALHKDAQVNLTRLSRFVRYESCFGVLYSISDPGIGKAPLTRLSEQLVAQQNTGRKKSNFFKSLWDNISPDDDGDWLVAMAKKKAGNAPFEDVGPAVGALLRNGARARDLGHFCAWHRYDASLQTLRFIEQSGMTNPEEADGLYESLLGADPSGLEGRPGSWPVKRTKASPSADKPLYQLRSVQACAFSHNSRTLAVAGGSGPVRLIDPATGQERVVCEGIKTHIYRVAFSPDNKQVAAGKIHNEITVCHTDTGKLLSRCKRTSDEISALEYASNGQLLCSSWCNRICVFDPRSGKELDPLMPFKGDGMVNDMAFSPDGRELLAHWQGADPEKCHATIWSWPDRALLMDINVGGGYMQRVGWLSKHNQFAISDQDTGVSFYDRRSGKRLHRIGDAENELLAVSPDGEHIITSGSDDKLLIWHARTRKQVRQLDFPAREAAVSPDGGYLVALNFRGASVWPWHSLL